MRTMRGVATGARREQVLARTRGRAGRGPGIPGKEGCTEKAIPKEDRAKLTAPATIKYVEFLPIFALLKASRLRSLLSTALPSFSSSPPWPPSLPHPSPTTPTKSSLGRSSSPSRPSSLSLYVSHKYRPLISLAHLS